MNENSFTALSRRERQIMDILYRKGKGSVAEVQDEIKDEISYSTVRALLRILEEKGYLKHEEEGRKYIYKPVIPKKKAIKNAIDRLLNTFFNNSVEEAITALLEFDQENLNESDLDRLNEMIEKARREEVK
jgi:predicted transcriptional regulator